eukprot:284815123_6
MIWQKTISPGANKSPAIWAPLRAPFRLNLSDIFKGLTRHNLQFIWILTNFLHENIDGYFMYIQLKIKLSRAIHWLTDLVISEFIYTEIVKGKLIYSTKIKKNIYFREVGSTCCQHLMPVLVFYCMNPIYIYTYILTSLYSDIAICLYKLILVQKRKRFKFYLRHSQIKLLFEAIYSLFHFSLSFVPVQPHHFIRLRTRTISTQTTSCVT